MSDPIGKSPNTPSSRDIAGAGGTLADLLTSPDLGARVKGLLLSVGEIKEYSGKNNDGSSYRTFSRRMEVFAGQKAGTVICAERGESAESFKALPLGVPVIWPIVGARTDGKQMVFRVDTTVQPA